MDMSVDFIKIKGHSGNTLNEIANQFAIKASNQKTPLVLKNYEWVIKNTFTNTFLLSKVNSKSSTVLFQKPNVTKDSYWWNTKNYNNLLFKWSNNLFSFHKHPPPKWEKNPTQCYLCHGTHKMSVLSTLTDCKLCVNFLIEIIILRGFKTSDHFNIFKSLNEEVQHLILRGLFPSNGVNQIKLETPNLILWSEKLINYLKFVDRDKVLSLSNKNYVCDNKRKRSTDHSKKPKLFDFKKSRH
jgi:hypothetical protein